MRDAFYQFLVGKGYKEFAPSGRKSTVYSYCNRIDLVCNIENMSWYELSVNIKSVIPKYDIGGIHEKIGLKSNSTAIYALQAFEEFCQE